MTEPTRTRRRPAPPGRVLALLLLVTTSVIGLLAAGLWMIAFAPERWLRVVGQVIAFLAMIQVVAVPFLWRSWRAQRAASQKRPR